MVDVSSGITGAGSHYFHPAYVHSMPKEYGGFLATHKLSSETSADVSDFLGGKGLDIERVCEILADLTVQDTVHRQADELGSLAAAGVVDDSYESYRRVAGKPDKTRELFDWVAGLPPRRTQADRLPPFDQSFQIGTSFRVGRAGKTPIDVVADDLVESLETDGYKVDVPPNQSPEVTIRHYVGHGEVPSLGYSSVHVSTERAAILPGGKREPLALTKVMAGLVIHECLPRTIIELIKPSADKQPTRVDFISRDASFPYSGEDPNLQRLARLTRSVGELLLALDNPREEFRGVVPVSTTYSLQAVNRRGRYQQLI